MRKSLIWLCILGFAIALLYAIARPKPTFYDRAQVAIAHVRNAVPNDKGAVIEHEMQIAQRDSSAGYGLILLRMRLVCESFLTPGVRAQLGAIAESECDRQVPGWTELAAQR